MDVLEKVKILGDAGKWDACASSASNRKVTTKDRIGDASACGICHSFTENGRCISLFKTLMTNSCKFDCKYCQNSTHCERKKTTQYKPEELAKVFMNLYVKNYVEGLFLSSGIVKNPDETTENMLEAINLIRNKYKFQGYVHFKVLPGTNRDLIKQANETADRLSINLEAPNHSRLSEISDIKDYKIDILRRQSYIKHLNPVAGQTTQLVVGGSDETDYEILKMIDWEYENMKLKRAYYSAFTPIQKTPLEFKDKTPLQREHKLYQVDFMMRQYDIKLREFRDIMANGDLPKGDPKVHLARERFDKPIDINEACYEDVIRIPGIGPQGAQKIMSLQHTGQKITKRIQLHSMGIVLKRAEPFIKINGHSQQTLTAY
ncbi:putative DNA modification/repair radical SAM protein [Candidatus Woesearchaeota archaeon]|jgi:putative DNA modification/repair radical SAM protein|nr:putative DNA modification/repair radical SAM protein [Candidatus Woesearchaeota archaeon]MBT3538225.1 putative DNA modification/repair radical SAM protein [Candidatus Woesearchaeota archaeon]MBT4696734.1 putative DNA modification/repair radical SAM protein [Candidatus Woesearchaeota archaeon]MBT4717242.1 putative DNA modification/repair radical SAM protein [Candidatus Woesearchaeota archaeon]MBT7105894.1 putative DNA modification/repair radical SAM protein [Candidatus Woesearchaeota archaeon